MASGSTSPILKIRQVVLHLYLADGSLEIFETRQVLLRVYLLRSIHLQTNVYMFILLRLIIIICMG